MDPKRTPRPVEPPKTLGEILYADPRRSAAVLPEAEWAQLVRSIADGDQGALHALYQRTHRLVFTLAMRISNRREVAEEITLDVFHDVWRRAPQYQPDGGSVIGWVMNLARSRAIDRLRFEQRKKRQPGELAPAGEPAIDAIAPDAAVVARQRRAVLRAALAELAPAERQAIEATFFGELSYSEAAGRLDQPLGTIKTRIRAALAKLRKALDEEGNPR